MGLMLFLTGSIVGVFVAQDLLLFYAFFEAMLIPLYVLVGVWGGPGRMGATLKFVLYTMAGSLLMLAAIVVYGLSEGTFDLVKIGASSNQWIFLGFIAAFAIKAPLFPLHGWLPDAYRESSPEVAAVLSGVVSKAAAYGFLRIAVAKFPEPAQDFRVPILALAAIGLVYGSLLAFRAPDLRGVIAYSSLAQMGLITMGVFAVNDLGLDGSVLQMVNHGLISATLFLLAGMVERRALTGELGRLGGMARGRPALATVLMTTGVIALAVPLSSAFAGEFLILAGVFQAGWGWAVVGAVAIVLAAMYVLRLISAVLHRDVGPAVSDSALDLRPAELGVTVPLLACLLALSVWPAAITQHSFRGDRAGRRGGGVQVIDRPHIDWFALAPVNALLVATALALLCAVLVPRGLRRPVAAALCALGYAAAFGFAVALYVRSADGHGVVADAFQRDRLAELATMIVAGSGLLATAISYSERAREDHVGEYYSLLAAAGAGMAFFVGTNNLMTLFLALEWFSISLYILCAIDRDRLGGLEAALKYLVIGGFGSAVLLFGSALVYGATGELDFPAIAAAGSEHDALLVLRPRDDHRRPRLQGVRRAVPHVDA